MAINIDLGNLENHLSCDNMTLNQVQGIIQQRQKILRNIINNKEYLEKDLEKDLEN